MSNHDKFIYASTHDFKTNISRYIRALEAGEYCGIILKRRKKALGLFALLKPPPYRPKKMTEINMKCECGRELPSTISSALM